MALNPAGCDLERVIPMTTRIFAFDVLLAGVTGRSSRHVAVVFPRSD